MVGTYTLRAFQVKIEKAPGAPEGVWTKPEDFKSWLPVGAGPVPDHSKKENYGKINYGVHAPAQKAYSAGKEEK